MIIDKDKTYRTRDGREVRIYATDGFGSHPIHGAINCSGDWISTTWRKNGRFYGDMESEDDLIEVKPRVKRTVWLIVFPDCVITARTREGAEFLFGDDAEACIKVEIDCEHGEGL